MASFTSKAGGCACNHIRYTVTTAPLIIHCCHCHRCQRESGSAFVINYLVESSNVVLSDGSGQPVDVVTASDSGRGQLISRCPKCHVAVWSSYGGGGPFCRFVRVGTMDAKSKSGIIPDVHIYTQSKVDWVKLPDDAPAHDEFYNVAETWSEETQKRWGALKPQVEEWKAQGGKFHS
jgi:hypothetical protein